MFTWRRLEKIEKNPAQKYVFKPSLLSTFFTNFLGFTNSGAAF